MLVDPDGRVLQKAGNQETILTEMLDLDRVTTTREYGNIGLTQTLKQLRDTPITFPPYAQGIAAGEGFDYWLLKFDGVAGNKDKEQEDPKGYGAIEYAYHRMAQAAGITMSECSLLEEDGRRHFMARRFDRLAAGEKLHMQSLCALAHFDFNQAGAYAYEQASRKRKPPTFPRTVNPVS